jgi:hypothetical protein
MAITNINNDKMNEKGKRLKTIKPVMVIERSISRNKTPAFPALRS